MKRNRVAFVPQVISISEFWRRISIDQFGIAAMPRNREKIKANRDIPWLLNLSIQLDKFFGRLAHHRVQRDGHLVIVKCFNCKYLHSPDPVICASHAGAVLGVVTVFEGRRLLLTKATLNNQCVFAFGSK